MKNTSLNIRLAAAVAVTLVVSFAPSPFFAQGALDPGSSPSASMHSLEEIWNLIQAQDSKIASLEEKVERQDTLIASMAAGMGVALPWKVMTVDADADVGEFTSIAFTPGGHPAISYYDAGNHQLKYAAYDGSAWQVEVVDGSNAGDWFTSLAFTPAGHPAISYYDDVNGDLLYAEYDGSTWQQQTVDDGDGDDVGRGSSLVFTPSGLPAIAYYDLTNTDLMYAEPLGGGNGWKTGSVVDVGSPVLGGSVFDGGPGASLAFTPEGQPAISYYERDNDDLKYAQFNGVTWQVETAASAGDIGSGSSLGFGPSGRPAISYIDRDDHDVWYARFNGSTWERELVGEGNGHPSSLAFVPGSGRPAISYGGLSGSGLMFAEYDGSQWQVGVVDDLGDVGKDSSMAYNPSGQPAISYRDETNGNLKFAVRQLFTAPSISN